MMVCESEGMAGHLQAVCKQKALCYHSLYAKYHDSCADDQSSGFLLHTVVFHHLAPFIDRRLVCIAWPLHRDPTAELHAATKWGVGCAGCELPSGSQWGNED